MAVLVRRNLPFLITECVEDQNGPYVMTKGSLQSSTISILNVYHPPAPPSDLISKVFLDFTQIHSDVAIAGGDFNGVMNPLIDSFPHRVMPLSPQAQSLKSGCEELRFVDVWRTIHPIDEDETVFSSTTHTSH